MRLDIFEIYPCCYCRSNAIDYFILVYLFLCWWTFSFGPWTNHATLAKLHVFYTYIVISGKLPRNGDELPNMSTLFSNAKFFFKASVPVNIPALGHQSSHISTSFNLHHSIRLWKFCHSNWQEIFCCYFYLHIDYLVWLSIFLYWHFGFPFLYCMYS